MSDTEIPEYGRAPRSAEEAALRDALEEDYDGLHARLMEFTPGELQALRHAALNMIDQVDHVTALKEKNR